MAARKLQMEIDKALKKVAEGVEEFKVMVDKLNQAASAAQREKIEAELKRDIKKLQRMRDQIKTWIGSSEIKDKTALLDNRRLIETQMELFKAIEKELKTKAFSKEGLGLPTKIDPEEEKKEACAEWIKNTFDRLNQHIDGYEAQQETILVSSGKRSKKATLANQEQIDKLKQFIHVHREHIRNLEIALRMLENGMLEADRIDELRESIDFFLDSCMDAGNNNDEMDDYLDIYNDLGLEHAAEDEIFAGPPLAANSITAGATPSTLPAVPPPTASQSSTTPISKSGTTSLVGSPKIGRANSVSSSVIESVIALTSLSSAATTPSADLALPPPVTPAPAPPPPQPAFVAPKLTAWNQKVKEGSGSGKENQQQGSAQDDLYSMDGFITPHDHSSRPAPPGHDHHPSAASTPMSSPTPSRPRSKSGKNNHNIATEPGTTSRPSSPSLSVRSLTARVPVVPKQQPAAIESAGSIPEYTPHVVGGENPERRPSTASTSKSVDLGLSASFRALPPSSPPMALLSKQVSTPSPMKMPVSQDPRCPESMRDLLAIFDVVKYSVVTNPHIAHAAPAASPNMLPTLDSKSKSTVPAPEEGTVMSAATEDLAGMLDATWTCVPSILDTERHTMYKPNEPIAVPPYYPTTPVPIMDDPRVYGKMDLDTLFYIFYFRQGTMCQYLAAKELKRQSWRFHKKYSTWFQRHEEPREITAEFEAGAYIYFDWEVGWCQRKKPEFKFEYRYLEDADLE